MKRDLKKWLASDVALDFCDYNDGETYDPKSISLFILQEPRPPEEVMQFIWMEAQKAFLKEMLEDIDNNIEKLFKGTSSVTGDRAKHIAYEEDLKKYIHNKYLYLKRKNGK